MSYSHIDGRLVAKPNHGPNAGKEFEFEAQTKVAFDSGTGYDLASGRRQRPVYTITKGAKPKLSIEFSSANEYKRWWKFLTGGIAPVHGQTATFSHVFTRSGVGTMAWRYFRVTSPAPNYDSGDSGVTAKADFTLEDAHLDGTTIYES